MALGLHRYSVRYDYTVKDGFEAVDGKRKQKYKTHTGTRTVECENGNADAKELAAILNNSHRREEPLDIKILAFNLVDESPASKGNEASASKVHADFETRILGLEIKVELLEEGLNQLMEVIGSGPEKTTEKPKTGKHS